jgi:hypothetical protein
MSPKFLEKIIAPVQQKLLAKGMCVGCMRNLSKEKRREPLSVTSELILCECGRAYVHVKEHKKYRRAVEAEVRSIPGL